MTGLADTAPRATVACLKGRLHDYGPSLKDAPPDYMYVGRRMTMGGWRLPQSIWANPFSTKRAGSAEAAVAMYEAWMAEPGQADLRALIPGLAGLTFLCWCSGSDPCHAKRLAFWTNFGFPGAEDFDLDRWIDFCGRVGDDVVFRSARRCETVTPVGQWAGAL